MARAAQFAEHPSHVKHHRRILILSTPAGGTERLFFDLGDPAEEGSSPPPADPLDLRAFRATVQKHGSDIDLFALLQQISTEPPPK